MVTLYTAGEQVWNAFVGAALGEVGMPDNGFKASESNTYAYFGGWMIGAVLPGLDIATGIRDLVSSLGKGKLLGAAIEAVGLVPVLGEFEAVGDLVSISSKWLRAFSDKAADAFSPLSDMLLKHLPAGARDRIAGVFPGTAKSGDDSGRLVADGGRSIDETKGAVGDG